MRTVHLSIITLLTLSSALACGTTGDGERGTSSGPLGTSSSSPGTGASAPPTTGDTATDDAAQPSGAADEETAAPSDDAAETDTDDTDDASDSTSTTTSPDDTDDQESAADTDDMPAEDDDGMDEDDSQDTTPDEPATQFVETCTDVPPDDRESCETWAQWGECGAEWLAGFCELSCGVCQPGMSSMPTEGNDNDNGGDQGGNDNGGDQDGNDDNGGDQGANASGALGDDNPYTPINGGMQGNSTRYWDCCKQSCGWSANASNPVSSCDSSGNNIGVNDQSKNVCEGGGNATTCHGMAPWAHSTALSFGYAAANGAGCGTCWQLQFTGSSGSAPGDQGSAAISGKTMVVMATNIGDLNGALHFDLLIPGGGVGQFNGCTSSLGIPEGELGANRGGFLSAGECSGGDHNARKECVRNKCTSVFGSRGLTDLEAGCLWFVDWFEVADNPDFLVQQVDCPNELRQFN